MFKKIEHTEIVSSNMERTLNYYTDILGFTIQWRRTSDKPPLEEVAFIELNGTLIEVFAVKEPAPLSGGQWQIGCRRIAIELDDMNKAMDYLRGKGVEISQKPNDVGTTVMAEILDPDGMPIQLVQRG